MTKPNDSGLTFKARWNKKTFERALRVSDLLALLLGGMSWPGQDIVWITDNDDIVADIDHHLDLIQVFTNIISKYLPHDLGHLKIGTARSDPGDLQIEDLLSIPDLVGGAVAELLTQQDKAGGSPRAGLIVPLSKRITNKTKLLAYWLSIDSSLLQPLVIQVLPAMKGSAFVQRIVDFYSEL